MITKLLTFCICVQIATALPLSAAPLIVDEFAELLPRHLLNNLTIQKLKLRMSLQKNILLRTVSFH